MTIDVTTCTRYTLVMSLLPTQPNLPTYERALNGIAPHVYTRNVLLLHANFERSERGLPYIQKSSCEGCRGQGVVLPNLSNARSGTGMLVLMWSHWRLTAGTSALLCSWRQPTRYTASSASAPTGDLPLDRQPLGSWLLPTLRMSRGTQTIFEDGPRGVCLSHWPDSEEDGGRGTNFNPAGFRFGRCALFPNGGKLSTPYRLLRLHSTGSAPWSLLVIRSRIPGPNGLLPPGDVATCRSGGQPERTRRNADDIQIIQ
jgi:hypothetical protein